MHKEVPYRTWDRLVLSDFMSCDVYDHTGITGVTWVFQDRLSSGANVVEYADQVCANDGFKDYVRGVFGEEAKERANDMLGVVFRELIGNLRHGLRDDTLDAKISVEIAGNERIARVGFELTGSPLNRLVPERLERKYSNVMGEDYDGQHDAENEGRVFGHFGGPIVRVFADRWSVPLDGRNAHYVEIDLQQPEVDEHERMSILGMDPPTLISEGGRSRSA